MSRARDLSKLGNPNVIKADENSVGFGTQVAGNHANADSSLISAGIITATAYYGDGSNLEGVASAGLGTAVDDTKDSIGQNIYFTNQELSINANTTVNAPDSSSIAYTQYQQVTVESGSELIIADGDSFIPDVLGIGTALQASTAGAGNGLFGTVYVDNIENVAGRGGPNFPLGITVAGVSTFSGNVSIGGTLTYEDVTNVDSIGIVTARNGVDITSGGINVTAGVSTFAGAVTAGSGKVNIDSNGNITAVNTASGGQSVTLKVGASSNSGVNNGNIIINNGGTGDASIQFDYENNAARAKIYVNRSYQRLQFDTAGSERLRIGSAGQIGLSGANYGTSGQVLTSQGASAAPQWAEAGGGAWEVVSTHVLSGSTSYIDSNGWSNAYQRYQLVMDDIYYSNTLFKVYLRIYQDSTSGNAGTLKTGNAYAYGSMDGQEAWGGMSSVPRQGNWSSYHKLAYNRDITVVNMAEYNFGMQTNVSSGNTYPYWHGTMNRNANIHLADNSIYNADKTEFLTGVRIYFYASDGTTAINPSQGRVTILRMKYS